MKLNLPLRLILGIAIMTCTLIAGLVIGGYFRSHESANTVPPEPLSTTTEIESSGVSVAVPDGVSGDYEIFSKEDSIAYEGYAINRERKLVTLDGEKTEVSFAVLRKGNVIVETFDGKYSGLYGNETNFGLFPFLGPGDKQLVVALSTYRDGRFWIVNLSPKLNIAFDSEDYGLSDGFNIADLDHDGIYEVTVLPVTFYNFADLPHCCPPELEIIFKYNLQVMKYLPANHLFVDQALAGIDDRIDRVNEGTDQDHRRNVLTILLRYLYAGKVKEGWIFFDREYLQADKEKLRSLVRTKLATEPIYQFIKRAQV